MATIKAGTYRFNDEIALFPNNAEYSLEFTSVFIDYQGTGVPKTQTYDGIMFADDGNALLYFYQKSIGTTSLIYVYEVVPTNNYSAGWAGIHHTITLTREQEVSEEFYLWFTENAEKVVATINHEGCIISGVKGGQTVALKCAGMQMETDVVVAVASNCVIEVNTLPTENIDKNAVYLCGGAYYKYANEFVDVVTDGTSWRALGEAFGSTILFVIVPTMPTTFDGVGATFYYVEDEDDFYMYEPDMGLVNLASAMETEVIVVGSVEDAGDTGCYAVMQNGFVKYLAPTGTLEITENGTYDVSEYASAEVNVESTGGNAEFNIAYGDTEPTDTSKLWVKTSEPVAVNVVSKVEFSGEELQAGVAALSTGMQRIGGAAVGTKVYLFGGHTTTGSGSAVTTISIFDTENNTITTLSAALPDAAAGIAAATVGTKVYLFGGADSSGYGIKTIRVFDTESNTITTLSATLPNAAISIAAAAVGTKVYLFGGLKKYGDYSLTDISVFDTETNTITKLSATLPTASNSIAAAAVGTKVYLFGGSSTNTAIRAFDTKSNTIITLSATVPNSAAYATAAAIGTKVYIFGGTGTNTAIRVFDTESDTITTLSAILPAGADNMASAAVGNKVYLFGGHTGSGNDLLSTINAFVVEMPLAENHLLVEASSTKNFFNLLPNVELGAANVYKGNADGNGEKVPAALYVDGAWVEV